MELCNKKKDLNISKNYKLCWSDIIIILLTFCEVDVIGLHIRLLGVPCSDCIVLNDLTSGRPGYGLHAEDHSVIL